MRDPDSKNLRGMLSITRALGGDDTNGARLVIMDVNSGCEILTVELPVEQFAECLLGQGRVLCHCEWSNTNRLGLLAEHKSELVPLPGNIADARDEADAIRNAVAVFEVDGWMGDDRDCHNPHRIRAGRALVSFVRFVKPGQKTDPEPAARPSRKKRS